MNAHAYERVWQESTAKNGARLVHLCLGRYANDRNVSYPGNETMVGETLLSLRAVQEALKKLVGAGEIMELEALSDYGTRKWQLFPRDGDADSSEIATDLHPRVSSTSTEKGVGDLSAESAPPLEESASLPLEGDTADQVRVILVETCRARTLHNSGWPSRDAVVRVLEDYPDRDAVKVARDLDFWARHGNGQRRAIKSMAGTYRNFMRQADPLPPAAESERRSAYDRVDN